jgi:cytoskeletal protein RodZ
MSVGILLRQARESAGMSLEELSELTCVRQSVLRDLESDNFQSSGGLAYARGHIRNIAKVLHANAELLVEEFNAMNQDFNRPMIDLLSENSVTPTVRRETRISFSVLGKAAAVIVALVIAIPTAASFVHSTKKPATPRPTSAPLALVSTTTTTNSNSDTTAVATKSSPVSVVVTANAGSTWLAVTDSSGTQIFSGMLANGTSQSFDDSQLINFTIGNAGAVNLNVNGKDAGTPGTRGEVVHLQFGPGASSQG